MIWKPSLFHSMPLLVSECIFTGIRDETKRIFNVEYDYMKNVTKIESDGSINSIWFLETDVNKRLKSHIEELWKRNPNMFEDMIKDIDEKINSLIIFSKSVYSDNLKLKENDELIDILDHYLMNFKALCPYFPIIPESYYLLEDIVKKNIARDSIEQKTVNRMCMYFASSDEHSKISELNRKILEIAVNIYKSSKLIEGKWIDNQTELIRFLENGNESYNLIKKVIDDYGWVNYQFFYGEPYTVNDILEKILNVIQEEDPNKKSKGIEGYLKSLQEISGYINKKFKKDIETQQLIKVLKKISYIRQKKYENFSYSGFLIRPLFDEIANRFHISYRDLMFLRLDELKKYLRNSINKNNLKQKIRNKYPSGYIMTMENGLISVSPYSITENENYKISKNNKIIHGTPASIGISSGKASVVITKEDFNKVEHGSILVTIAATPDYIVIYDKIAGIVTDIGGVTSHSAIVARELGIPCVSNTKIATKSIKDGELILIDGEKGIVKKIRDDSWGASNIS